jgi:ATP-dependent Clp protease adaptor protein ClpS
MTQTIVERETETDIDIPNPGKYKVVLKNDDATPMDFVIALLISVFKHSQEVATRITMEIHNDGAGVAGVYSYEVAEQKGIEGTLLARQHGWPLQIQVEPE